MDKNLIGSKNILIKSGKIMDPLKCEEYFSDIYIKDGLVADIGKEVKTEKKDLAVIDASGCLVCPGFVDMHVHLRDPGDEDEETIESGAAAALKGGITSVACMPNTKPVIDSEHLIKYILEKSREIDFKVFPVASMTKGIEGKKICEFGILAGSGAVAFSDDGRCVADSELMYEIMKYSNQFGLPLILHEEDYNFSNYGLINEGRYSSMLGLGGISSLGEDVIVARDIILAKKAKAKIHITHVSTKGSVEIIRKAKEDGVNITCDVTPHHLNFKVNPPIRSEGDRKAIIEGIREGVIDAVASDHAPHLDIEKNTAFEEASFGTIGLETLFSASFTRLCREEKISLPKFISLITSSPAKILGIDAGKIETGKTADIAVIDTEAAGEVKIDGFASKSKNSAFIGQKLWGKVAYTISNGKLVYVSI